VVLGRLRSVMLWCCGYRETLWKYVNTFEYSNFKIIWIPKGIRILRRFLFHVNVVVYYNGALVEICGNLNLS